MRTRALVLTTMIALIACGGSPPPPFASLTGTGVAPRSAADADKIIIRRHIHEHDAAFRACYAQALAAQPGLAGRVDVQFVIGADGVVTDAHATGLDAAPSVAPCVADEISRVQFPHANGPTTVSYPFTFHPTAP